MLRSQRPDVPLIQVVLSTRGNFHSSHLFCDGFHSNLGSFFHTVAALTLVQVALSTVHPVRDV